ncbi:uncharacterized protein LOC105691351 [Athalia rosae]|uniref:uncharacterized protein LOC105691351 n=1 Tax=Athalia rosae TaxID=37344 RepID=UPI0020342E15|nr:uncharacterized protein LOC105691351 [Athalia rosae]
MADDSFENLKEHAFHPADPPHGLRNYDIGSLKPDQQKTLNKMKMIHRIENEKYFKAHPEIRGLISILLRQVFQFLHRSVELPSLKEKLFRSLTEREIRVYKCKYLRLIISFAFPASSRHILTKQPSSNVHEIAGAFFTRPRGKIVKELMDYLADKCHSEPIMDALRKEMTKRHDVPERRNSTDMDESVEADQKFSSTSSELLKE